MNKLNVMVCLLWFVCCHLSCDQQTSPKITETNTTPTETSTDPVELLSCTANAEEQNACGTATYWQCTENEGAAPTCEDIDDCLVDGEGHNACGVAANWACTNHEGVLPTCVDLDECAVADDGTNGCGLADKWQCVNYEGIAASCTDIDECAVADDGTNACGLAQYWTCTNNEGASPSCTDIDECAVADDGTNACGVAANWACTNHEGVLPTCEDINDCLVDGEGQNACGVAAHWTCSNNAGAAAGCVDINDCLVDGEGQNACGVAANWTCSNNEGAAATCQDCNGDVDGLAVRDNCGVCVGGNTGQTACLQDCQGNWGGSAAQDVCGTCDTNAANNCTLTVLPAVNATGTPWELEMGVRVQVNEPSLVLNDATVSNLATALTVTAPGDVPVDGETKLFVNESSRQILISFIPDKVLYGEYIYKLIVDISAILDVGSGGVNLSSALQAAAILGEGINHWSFTTAEMTRFVLPILFEYDDTTCDCTNNGTNGQDPCQEPENENQQVAGMCYSVDNVNEIIFGYNNNQIRGYWSAMSQGRLVLSKLRAEDGQMLGAVHLRRTGINGAGNTTNTLFRASEKTAAIASISVDFDRYALMEKPDGNLNVLANYRDRAFIAGRVGGGHYTHHNIYLMSIYGNPETSYFGSSSTPVTSADLEASLSHQDYYYGSYVWLHESAHGFFGMQDLYYDIRFPGTSGAFSIMGTQYNNSVPAQTSDPWHTIMAEIAVTESPYDATDVTNILADGTADASCGSVATPCLLHPRYPNGKIWRFPAVIEAGQVVGEY